MKPGLPLKKNFLLLTLLPLVIFASGCVMTPKFEPSASQQALVPEKWIGPVPSAATSANLSKWWETWGDTELLSLVEAAQASNTDIRTAKANLDYALAQLTVADSAFFPTIGGSSDGGRSHRMGRGSNSFGIGLNGNWTIDAGGTYAAALASRADYVSSLSSLGDVQVAIAAQVATAYVNLKLSQKLIEVAQQNLVTQKEALNIAQWRYTSGLVDSTDVDQARTSYEQTVASLPVHQYSLQQYRNVLARLTNKKPVEIIVSDDVFIPQAPENLALSIPADVLRQRPSVKEAEAKVQAALARHTEARSALYPSLTISGNFGLSGTTVGSLGEFGTHVSSILGSISLPIFNAGRLRAQVDAMDARVKAANAAYEASLLLAVTEVEDALNQLWAYQTRSKSLEIALKHARFAQTNALQNYRAGLQDFTVVLTTQKTLLAVEESLASAQAQIAKANISLYQALGGGWELPKEMKAEDRK